MLFLHVLISSACGRRDFAQVSWNESELVNLSFFDAHKDHLMFARRIGDAKGGDFIVIS